MVDVLPDVGKLNPPETESTSMEAEESRISVWVCREEKLVLGLSRRTTCADVIQVLLEDQNLANTQSYCIVEKWRGFERILPQKTRIFRLWVAWAEEQDNVRFVLVVRTDAHLASAARCAEAKVVQSKLSPCVTPRGASWSPTGHTAPEKQRRVVRKAFRKLEKMNKRKAKVAHRDAMETLVHVVVSQDHTIRQQEQRISELDAQIESCEAQVHYDRMKMHGVNYVQNTYLDVVDAAAASIQERESFSSSSEELEEFILQCEEVVRLQEELWEQEALIEIITEEIQEELNQRWMQRRDERRRSKEPQPDSPKQLLLEEEEERIRTQLDASLYIGLRLNTDLQAIRSDLELTQQICREREKEMRDLLEEVNTWGLEDDDERGREQRCLDDERGVRRTVEGKAGWVEQARGLSKAHNGNDDDSDTGLSSLHSQESDSLPVWESLV